MDSSASTPQQPLSEKTSYKDTLNLPQTDFPMKAGAATREPEIEAFWEAEEVYAKAMASRDKHHKFILHDGPPYLSSDQIHIGTALNKILKDIVTRYKYQRGFYAPYVPGYDGHGLPIENKVVQSIKGGRKAISAAELRQKCREFGLKNLKGQEKNFKRLGVWGNWENPYNTTDPEFEAEQVRLFWLMYDKGYVYKGLKPVYWSPASETALADAEVEYHDHESHSIYVKFAINSIALKERSLEAAHLLQGASVVIWTTTPWTLPANLAHSVHPEFIYSIIETQAWGRLVVAKELLSSFVEAVQLDNYTVLGELTGSDLELISTQHPFLDRNSLVLLGDHVTLDAGTGIVHTAPGHGMEDYLVCQKYDREVFQGNPIGVFSPLNDQGCYTEQVGEPRLVGQFYEKANDIVLDLLREKNALLAHSKFTHSYPHDWRTHTPVIYRATEQWFVSVDKFRQDTLAEINKVTWIPERGKNRIASMVENRSDWCISRQRVWGVPIPVFYDQQTGETVINEAIIHHLVAQFKVYTTDIWWEKSPEELLVGLDPAVRAELNLDQRALTKEMDIMDVWFDSGVTHTAVVKARSEELGDLPVELYLEGSDQHRGWFQSSLLTSMMVHGHAPYKEVLTHGFVLDAQGRKMSKSLGNVVDPNTVIQQYGADVLRLWVASVDYSSDVRIGKETIGQLVEVYKKIRNTLRFILGNLHDFDPAKDALSYESLSPFDTAILHTLHTEVIDKLTQCFDQYEFHPFSQILQNFCVVDLSERYFDYAKDILYCDAIESPRRRGIQTVLYDVLKALVPLLVPIMPHLAEDVWFYLDPKHKPNYGYQKPPESIILAPWPEVGELFNFSKVDLSGIMAEFLTLRTQINQAVERLRADKLLNKIEEAEVLIHFNDLPLSQDALTMMEPWLKVSKLKAYDSEDLSEWVKPKLGMNFSDREIYIRKTTNSKCDRCWNYRDSVGTHADAPTVCTRCYEVVHLTPAQCSV